MCRRYGNHDGRGKRRLRRSVDVVADRYKRIIVKIKDVLVRSLVITIEEENGKKRRIGDVVTDG